VTKIRIFFIAAFALALALYFVAYIGLGAVFSAAVAVGWSGFSLFCVCGLALFPVLGLAWYVLLPVSMRTPWPLFVWARMVRDAATEVLPFSQLGGIALGTRAAILEGATPAVVFGSTIVDVTAEVLAQIAYTALGVAILSARAPRIMPAGSLTRVALIGLVVAAAGGGLFLVLQRHGRRLTETLAARLLPRAVAATAAVGAALVAIHRSPARIGLCAALHFAGWIGAAAGVWIAFRLIGQPVDFASVIAIESLICAARSAAVFIPNGWGVQEAAYAVLTPLFGIGAEFGLAVSLLKRARDIALGVPVLVIWQAIEGRRALTRGPDEITE
jgi:putative membrane protein